MAKATGKALANVEAELQKQMEAIQKQIGKPSGNKISVKGKQFKLPDGLTSEGPMEVVILAFVSANKYYGEKYNEKNIKPPICFAVHEEPDALAPDASSPEKQAKSCSECPMNQYGSDGDAKACRNLRLVAVMQPDAKKGDEPIYVLEVSPTALREFDGYINSLRVAGRHPMSVVTSVSFDPTKTHPRLQFKLSGANKNVNLFFARQKEALDIIKSVPDMTPRSAAPAKKTSRR